MALKVTVNKPQYPKGTEFDVRGLGLLKNGESTTLTEDQERDFAAFTGTTVREGLKGDESFKIEGTADWKDGVETVHPTNVSDTNEAKGGE